MPNETLMRQIAKDEINRESTRANFSAFQVPNHQHNGVDSNKVAFPNILNRQFTVSSHVLGTAAATATNYGAFWIAPFDCSIQTMLESHGRAGSDAGTVVVFVVIFSDGDTFGDGTPVKAFNLKSTADTVATSNLLAGRNPAVIHAGQRLALVPVGVLTNVADVIVTVLLEYRTQIG